MYKVELSKHAKKDLIELPQKYYVIVTEHIISLEENPFQHGVIKLQGVRKLLSLKGWSASYYF